VPKNRDAYRVRALEVIRSWRGVARHYRDRGAASLKRDGLWGATAALTFDARAFVMEQCARDFWRYLQGRPFHTPDPEIKAANDQFREVRKQAGERRTWLHGEVH